MARAELSGMLRSPGGTIGNFNFRNTTNGITIADRPGAQPTGWKTYATS